MTDREVAEINVLRAIVRQADAIAILETQLAAVTAEIDTLKAQQENREADIYTAGYDAGEEAAARDIKQLKTQLAAMTAERDALKAELESAMIDPNTVFETPDWPTVDVLVKLNAQLFNDTSEFRTGRLLVDPQDVSSKTSQPANQSGAWLSLKTNMENGVKEKRLHLFVEGDGAGIEIEIWGLRVSYELDQLEMREMAYWLTNHVEPITPADKMSSRSE